MDRGVYKARPLSVGASLRCDHCKKLFEYREQIVALRETGSGVEALRETELEAGTLEGAFGPVGKFHVSCYEAMRTGNPESSRPCSSG
jgi:hypothetical protein